VTPRPDTRSAFSLIELLIVIAIIAVLSALALPAFNSIRNAGGLTKTANDIAGILEQARAYAMAQNTYVWVGFRKDGADTLVVGVGASKTGSSTPATDDVVQLGKITRFENIQLTNNLPANSGARPAANVQLMDATDFVLNSGTNSFSSQVIRWDSRGEARINATQLSRLIEIGLLGSAGGIIRNASNNAAVQIGGLSGAVIVYRP
jgi:prepilin-type N-terminal cleavage/methylation domain-containing protein